MIELTLTVPPEYAEFTAYEEKELEAELLDCTADTTVERITTMPQLIMDYKGMFNGELHITEPAFHLLCDKLAPYLFSLVLELSGQKIRARRNKTCKYAKSLAIKVFNQVCKLRFDCLKNAYYVIGNKNKVIEGFFSNAYAFISNSDFYYLIKSKLEDTGFCFAKGFLLDRRLSVLFVRGEIFAYEIEGMPVGFQEGLHVVNGDTGCIGIQINRVVWLHIPNIGVFPLIEPSSKISHRGGSLQHNIINRLNSVIHKESILNYVSYGLNILAGQSLNLCLADECKLNDTARVHLIKELKHLGFATEIAKDCTKWTVFVGGFKDKLPKLVNVAEVAARTKADVLLSCLQRAAKYPPDVGDSMSTQLYLYLRKMAYPKVKKFKHENKKAY